MVLVARNEGNNGLRGFDMISKKIILILISLVIFVPVASLRVSAYWIGSCPFWDGSNWRCVWEDGASCGYCGKFRIDTVYSFSCPCWQWGSWYCYGQGVCAAGATETQGCGGCATQTRTCTTSCAWSDWSACTGGGVCTPGQAETQGCGFGGTQTRTCTTSCAWSDWSACVGSGECNPGTTEKKRCGNCGTTTRQCQSNYFWSEWAQCVETNSCTYSSECDTGANKIDDCGNSCLRQVPSTCSKIKFQIRTAPNVNGQIGQWTDWTGPDGTSATYYETYGQSIPSLHNKNKYIQYKVILSSDDLNKIPHLDDFEITYYGKFNQKPIVNAKDQEVTLGTPVKFNATAIDIGGRIISYNWDFGDNATATGSSAVHTYAKPGAYNAKVTVVDNDGANATANIKVFVNTYNCLSEAEPGIGPASNLFTPSDSVIQQKATEALLEYAQSKGIKVQDIDTTIEFYEAANDYITKHMTYLADTFGWDGVSAKTLFNAGDRGCGNKYCGDCEDFAITTEALLRAMGVSPKCAYVACSRNHCWNILNIGSRFRIVEPQINSIGSEFNSKSYEWKDPQGNPNYATDNVFNDKVGIFYIVNDANPETYTLNYPSTSGLPDSSKKCPASYSIWKGEGDQTYFEDKCP